VSTKLREDARRAAGDANVAFVTKPWTVSDLLAQVRAMLDAPARALTLLR